MRLALIALGLASPAAAETVLLVDSPFDQDMTVQPTRVYDLDPVTGALTLKADLGPTYTPVLGLAAASGTVLYAIGSDHGPDPEQNCFSCVLLRVELAPPSTTPASITAIGQVRVGEDVISEFTQLTFRGNGDLYGISELTEALYLIDPETASAMEVGPLTVDLGGGCTTTTLDITGGDLAFDALDRLWLWNNTSGRKGMWEVSPGNGCAIQRTSCSSSRNMSGLFIADRTSPNPELRSASPNDDRLYRVFTDMCPVNGEPGSHPMRLNGLSFDHMRGDSDSPFCVSDPLCDDADACTTDQCSPGGCRHEPVACDDGNACTDDLCDPQTGCQNAPVACDDGNACTVDSCDPIAGCQTQPVSCDDGNACTVDSCDPIAGCQTQRVSCNDGNVCTVDECDPGAGCTFDPTPGTCDDGNPCTADDACSEGACSGVPVILQEVTELSVTVSLHGTTRLTWASSPESGITYAVVSGPLSELGGAEGIPTATCVGSGPAPELDDSRTAPPEGDGFYYLVRAGSACGIGSYGLTSGGAPRTPGTDCP